jgi:hypothetical protein
MLSAPGNESDFDRYLRKTLGKESTMAPSVAKMRLEWAQLALFAAALLLATGAADAQPPARHGGPPVGPHVGFPPSGRPVHPGPGPVLRPAPPIFHPSPRVHSSGGLHFVFAPPAGHVAIAIGGVTYYRYGGVYYRPYWYDGQWVYRVVTPPIGVDVTASPPAPDRVIINGQVYYRDGSTFYVEAPSPAASKEPTLAPASKEPTLAASSSQYVVVRPPIGAIVERLPEGAKTLRSGSARYYHADGVYYLPIQTGEQTKYVVVEKPN